jgi:hypothetical protein
MDFAPMTAGRWSATAETPLGPVTAVGDTIGEAKIALEQLLVIARALEVSRGRLPR